MTDQPILRLRRVQPQLAATVYRSSTRARMRVAIVFALCAALVAMGARTAAHAATPIQVTLTIQRFVEIDDPEDSTFEQSHGEYYAIADVGGTGNYQDSRNLGYPEVHNGADITPYWRFTATVDAAAGTIPVNFQVKDDDTGVPFTTDDVMDINPQPGLREMHATFNLATGDWSGDNGCCNLGFAQGNGDSERGKVLFDIGFNNDNSAGDGIPDGVKHSSIYDISDGHALANMATLGADPCRKNVALQIDYMSGAADGHTHDPLPGAVPLVKNAFDNAPVAAVANCHYPGYPRKSSGVDLVAFIDHAVPEVPIMVPDDTGFLADKKAGFPDGLNPYFFYLIMVHDHDTTGSSGLSCPANSNDYVVSLGSWTNETGTASDQGSSIMHELGHCLGLGHGGGDGINCKPNYLSVMNYDFQTTGIPSASGGAARYDYSRAALPTLNENSLVEGNGVGGDGKDLTAWTPDNGATKVSGSTSGALDWDNEDKPGVTDSDSDTVGVDVNALSTGSCGTVGTSPNPSPGETLTGYDDWSNLKYRGPLNGGGSGANPHPGSEDMNFAQAQEAKAFWATTFTSLAGGSAVSGTEGAALGQTTLATVTDAEPTATASQFTATIDWGDTTTSSGTVAGPTGGPFTVTGNHTYIEEGSYTITTTLRDSGGATKTATTSASISDAALHATGSNIVTTNPVSGTLATFTDDDPAGAVADYTASINWGDGATTTGTVAAVTSGGFAVSGTHTYTALGPQTATITINDAGGAMTSATSNIIIYAFPSRGDFVIGDRNAAVGSHVTYWGDQWSRANSLSRSSAPLSFKGFENSLTPPKCGTGWATNPGASSSPVSSVPSYMGTIVSSKVLKSGSNIFSGDIPELVVVKTDPGYTANPAIPGTGTIVAVICHL